ncbi:hypothetical protein H2200_005442 [Cladophialophora chaetospira]|uniref:Glutathione S-transferase n=1 Tax=Cladophialophora chaetospira TaxID=386627 RepID=A0AA39CJM2_9EURO|nr:hypothetical protein H2200_005442 [Cladophialophora chaetospira]
MVQPLTLHAHVGPNPWKVALVLEELKVPYQVKIWATTDLKHPPFTNLNPNGHTPVIEDPNTDTLLWESGAIIEYLLETYDKAFLISFPTARERSLARQWLYFQVAFQGPPLSQVFVFSNFERNSKARAYFVKESLRVLQVLDQTLQHREWLVGGKRSAADLVYIPYYAGLAV